MPPKTPVNFDPLKPLDRAAAVVVWPVALRDIARSLRAEVWQVDGLGRAVETMAECARRARLLAKAGEILRAAVELGIVPGVTLADVVLPAGLGAGRVVRGRRVQSAVVDCDENVFVQWAGGHVVEATNFRELPGGGIVADTTGRRGGGVLPALGVCTADLPRGEQYARACEILGELIEKHKPAQTAGRARSTKRGRPAIVEDARRAKIIESWRAGTFARYADCAAALGGNTTARDVRLAVRCLTERNNSKRRARQK